MPLRYNGKKVSVHEKRSRPYTEKLLRSNSFFFTIFISLFRQINNPAATILFYPAQLLEVTPGVGTYPADTIGQAPLVVVLFYGPVKVSGVFLSPPAIGTINCSCVLLRFLWRSGRTDGLHNSLILVVENFVSLSIIQR